jgi:hypothetical protein
LDAQVYAQSVTFLGPISISKIPSGNPLQSPSKVAQTTNAMHAREFANKRKGKRNEKAIPPVCVETKQTPNTQDARKN